ncbi:MAG: magnesium/cobalt transporter CorA [Rubrobacteraceae bacterium]
MIVDSEIYADGHRTEPCPLEETLEACRQRNGFAWIDFYEPSKKEFDSVARDFGLHKLAVEDAAKAHQRPKLQQFGEVLFMVLKSARYLEESETVEFGEIHVFMGPDFVLVIRRGEASPLHKLRERLEENPDLLLVGPTAVLHAVLERIVGDYEPVVEGLGNDMDEIEEEVFGGKPDARRIYELSREVLSFRRAVQPLARILEHLTTGSPYNLNPEIIRHLRAVHDQTLRTSEQVEGFRELLSNILSVNLTLVSVEQNNQVQKISAWAAILIVPTIITGLYGMNFRYMPELNWLLGYPFAILLMVAISALLYLRFKRSGWL